ncbi:MAG: CPBP family intramembrane metalloprotease [Deltaproteobacteria bacterium]|nr:CPBP family intramembrane metalloprotease [Deltaproteobacteria bacterium]
MTSPEPPDTNRHGQPDLVAGRHALYAFLTAAALVTVLVRINVTLPAVGHLGSALVAVLFLYLPVYAAHRRGEDLDDYGFHARPLRRGLLTAGIAFAIIFPIFILGYFAFYEIACGGDSVLRHLVPRGMCSHYGGLAALHLPAMTWKLAEFCAVQLVVVALPEELFFRGFLHGLLEKRFPPKRRILGGGVGRALVLSSLAFALIHLPKDGDPLALATFFPGLLFGWMYSATRSVLASTVTHAGSNILIRLLDLIGQR